MTQQPGSANNRNRKSQRPAWQLPRGVSNGTWDYVAEPTIATEYDAFHDANPLMQLDTRMLLDRLVAYPPDTSIVADFGCGTARIARLLTPRGYKTLSVDLSLAMLETSRAHLQGNDRATLVHSNLVELDWLCDQSIDVAVCLFSSLGMIRGRQHRIGFLSHVRRSLKSGGTFMLHVHNRGHSWLDPQGPWWLISTWVKSKFQRDCEPGDRVYVYRGLPNMFLHIYSQAELRSDLRQAGFRQVELHPLNLTGSDLLPLNTFPLHLRAGGFIVFASNTSPKR